MTVFVHFLFSLPSEEILNLHLISAFANGKINLINMFEYVFGRVKQEGRG